MRLAQLPVRPALRRRGRQPAADGSPVSSQSLSWVPAAEDGQRPAIQPHPRPATVSVPGHGIPDPAALTHDKHTYRRLALSFFCAAIVRRRYSGSVLYRVLCRAAFVAMESLDRQTDWWPAALPHVLPFFKSFPHNGKSAGLSPGLIIRRCLPHQTPRELSDRSYQMCRRHRSRCP